MYNGLRGRRDLAVTYGCTGVPPWERRTLSIAYPMLIRVIDRYLDITPATAAESEARVRATFDTVAERLGDGRPYLCGDRFTAADLTFSALAGVGVDATRVRGPAAPTGGAALGHGGDRSGTSRAPGWPARAGDVPRGTALSGRRR